MAACSSRALRVQDPVHGRVLYFQYLFVCPTTDAESLCRLAVLQGNMRAAGTQLVAEVEHSTVFKQPEEMPNSVREY